MGIWRVRSGGSLVELSLSLELWIVGVRIELNWIVQHTIGVWKIRGLVVGIRKCPTPGHQNVQPKLGILFLTGRQPCQQVHMTDVIYILTKYRMRVRNSLLVVSINKDYPWPKNKNLQNLNAKQISLLRKIILFRGLKHTLFSQR